MYRHALAVILMAMTARAAATDYERDVRPLLAKRCFGCHGAAAQMSKLRLDRKASVLAGGESGVPALEPGKSARSLLIRYVRGDNPKMVMPPAGPRLSPEEIALLARWIDEGAIWPAGSQEGAPAGPSGASAGKDHWSFRQPVAAPLPAVSNAAWVRNPIDAFVLARLEARGWKPSPIAAPAQLQRRLYFDLIGLPPTLAEQDSLTPTPAGLDVIVDQLLARPQYGERWARHWLDLVRYADTNAYERDAIKPNAWRYRDWVIDAFNADKPYDRFVTEQLAGDELPDANASTMIATGFHRLGPWDDEPADPAEDRFDQLDDIVSTTSQAFLGLTLGCARCHNHKFEPLLTRDYYGMVAVFSGLERPRNGRTELDRPVGLRQEIDRFNHREERIAGLRASARLEWLSGTGSRLAPSVLAAFLADAKTRNEEQKKLVRDNQKVLDAELATLPVEREVAKLKEQVPDLPRGYFMEETSPRPPVTHILIRGKATAPGPEAPPVVPAVLVNQQQPAFPPGERTSHRRLHFARWLASRENPLAARVIVNRVWQWHFGEGLVRTASDFGRMGDKPSHPELLDWLAVWFMDNGWSLKKLHRLILTSNAWRMAKTGNEQYAAEDPENRLLWRANYRRLEGEAILDAALAVSGRLNPMLHGPFVYPAIPKEALDGSSDPEKIWQPFDEAVASRRAIYYIVKRSLMVPLMEALDLCDTARSSSRRLTTSVAPQALQLFNGDFVRRQARHLAARLREQAGPGAAAQIDLAFRLTLARRPEPDEREKLLRFLQEQSLEEMCRVILNLNEFAYTN